MRSTSATRTARSPSTARSRSSCSAWPPRSRSSPCSDASIRSRAAPTTWYRRRRRSSPCPTTRDRRRRRGGPARPRRHGAAFWAVLARAWTPRVWVNGPGPMALVLAVLAIVRRRRLVLGVRQDTLAYARSRVPGSAWPAARPSDCWRRAGAPVPAPGGVGRGPERGGARGPPTPTRARLHDLRVTVHRGRPDLSSHARRSGAAPHRLERGPPGDGEEPAPARRRARRARPRLPPAGRRRGPDGRRAARARWARSASPTVP